LSERDEIIEAVTANVADERSDERMRIAASIHDEVLQSLHYLTLHAQVIREDLRHGKLLQLEEDIPLLLDISRKTADQARALVGDLRTSPVGRAGAAEALTGVARELADEFDGEIVTDIRETSGNSERQTLIYQVGREALINAVRHSDAATIRVRLTDEADGTLLVVEDSGKGFSLEGGAKQGHFGLLLMRERVRTIGGSIDVASQIGRGTRVVALFPPPRSA
jgi:signal transduction histidine kinase